MGVIGIEKCGSGRNTKSSRRVFDPSGLWYLAPVGTLELLGGFPVKEVEVEILDPKCCRLWSVMVNSLY